MCTIGRFLDVSTIVNAELAGIEMAVQCVESPVDVHGVQFGDAEEDCWIKNKRTGKKIPMKKKRGSYVLEVEFVMKKMSVAPTFVGQP